MEHLAIDLGSRESQICVRSSDGTIVEERRIPTRRLRSFLATRPSSRVIVETCSEAFGVAAWAIESGHEIRIVPATLVKELGVGRRRLKTDRRDAQVLSEVSCRIDLPSVHIPSAASENDKACCGMRDTLVRARTKLINTVRSCLRRELRPLGIGSAETFALRVTRHFEQTGPSPMPSFVSRQLVVIETLTEQIRQAEREIAERAHKSELCRRLMTVPGVGPIVALRFVACIDDVTRFTDAHQVESYLGLVPGERSSSDSVQRLSITKAGSSAARWLLVQAAWAALRCKRQDPLQLWARELGKRRGRRIAVTALARKIAGILFALWRDGSVYRPPSAATTIPVA